MVERKVVAMNPLTPSLKRSDADFVKKFDAREAEWERKWNLAFGKKTATTPAKDILTPKTTPKKAVKTEPNHELKEQAKKADNLGDEWKKREEELTNRINAQCAERSKASTSQAKNDSLKGDFAKQFEKSGTIDRKAAAKEINEKYDEYFQREKLAEERAKALEWKYTGGQKKEPLMTVAEATARLERINKEREEGKYKKTTTPEVKKTQTNILGSGDLLARMEREGQITRSTKTNEPANPAKDAKGAAENNGPKERPETEEKPTEIRIGSAVWKTKDYDLPVKIIGYAGRVNGKDYVFIEGSKAAVPLDEIEYPTEPNQKPEQAKEKTETKTDEESPETKAMREKEEKKKRLEKECKDKLEAAEKKGKEEGEKAGREKLLHEIEEKKNKNIFRKGFNKVKDFVKRNKKVIIAGAVGAVAAVGIAGALQYFGILPIWLQHLSIYAKTMTLRP